MISYYASGQSPSAGQYFQIGALGLAVGIGLIWAGRYQRRRGRETGAPDKWDRRLRLRRVLTRPSLSWNVAAKFYGRIGWSFAVCGALLLAQGIAALRH